MLSATNGGSVLGHVVSAEGVRPDPTNGSKIIEWPRPRNPKQVKQFVATGSYSRRFIKNFSQTAKPLHELTKKDVPFSRVKHVKNPLKN